jgi:hypothetical protein
MKYVECIRIYLYELNNEKYVREALRIPVRTKKVLEHSENLIEKV